MKISKQIYCLRSKKNLSQSELADALQVSRQSVSKWETGQSVPDLDKLLRMAKLFDVTLDELVNGTDEAQVTAEPANSTQKACASFSTQKILGVVFLVTGLLAGGVMSLIFGPILLIPGSWLMVCGCICLFVKKHAGLWIGWSIALPFLLGHSYVTGFSMWSVFYPDFYRSLVHHFAIHHGIVLVLWGALLALVWATVCAWKKQEK